MTENEKKAEQYINDKLKELEENKDYKDIKEKLNNGNNFIDYFLVLGLEPIIYRKTWLFDETLEEINKKYKEDLKPKIISSFPNFEKSTTGFDESILTYCFPNGFELMRASKKPNKKIYSFILDNNYYNLNYPQKYLTCLIFYESIIDYKILSEIENNPEKNEIKSIDRMAIAAKIKNSDIFIPKCLLFISLYPYFGEFEKIIIEIYNYSLNIFTKLTPNNIKTPLSKNNETQNNNRTSLRRMSVFREVERENGIYYPVDKIIENILIELPVPPRGVTTIKYFLNENENTIKQNEMNQLPLLDVNINTIFTDFDVKDVITIYNYIFLEYRILFFSKNIEFLNNYIYSLLSFLYPFQYQYQVITILPKENFEIIESITPFIAGINQSYEEDFFNDYQLSDCILVVDIDKGKLTIINETEDNKLPEFPMKYKKTFEKKLQDTVNKYLNKSSNKNPKKAKIYLSYIEKRKEGGSSTSLNSSISTNNETMDSNKSVLLNHLTTIKEEESFDPFINVDNEENKDNFEFFNNLNIDYNFNQEVNDLFFNFNASLLSNYNQYLNRDFYSLNSQPCLEILFKVSEYLKTIPEADKNFYDKFISETQIFGDFLYLRMIPKNSKEKIRILKFDEKINENSNNNRNSKNFAVFTNTTEYEFVNKHAIQKPRSLTEKEIKFYENKDNQKLLLTYGIIAYKEIQVKEKKEKKDENNVEEIILFKYPIFPKLTTLFFLADNIKDYFPPNNWNEDINLINEDIISKSHLSDVSIRLDDMKKYIYLCWMQMWALTFWYCEENEKNYRFQELIKIIELSSCYEMQIFNLLFEVLSTYGEDNMVLKLYDVLLKKRLNPNLKVHNIVMKIMEKKKDDGNISDKLKEIIENEKKKIYFKTNFSRRAFRTKLYPNILTEHIKFYSFYPCLQCQKMYNLESISKNLKEMKRDLFMIKCENPSCGEPFLPRLTIQFGEEINKNGDMKNNTCKYESVVLFSPYILKNNYNTQFSFSNMGIKLDVEQFMFKYSNIFWNSLWYFKLNGLEYDFMLPYYFRRSTNEIKSKLNIALEVIEKNNTVKNNENNNITKNENNKGENKENNNGENNDETSEFFDQTKFEICSFDFMIKKKDKK